MITQRNIGVCILLCIVTLGIYGIYWFVCLTNEINAFAGQQGEPSGGVCFLLTLVTFGIYGFYWAYKCGEKIDKAKMWRNIPSTNTGIIYLLIFILGFGIVSYALMQNELNKFA